MKKTLLIDSRPGGDFSLDLIFAGLVRRLGPENVIDFPAHQKHRAGRPILVGDHEKDYGSERSSLCYTDHHDRLQTCSASEITEMLKRNEIERIFMDERDESFELFLSLRANWFNVPVVVVAGHDRFWNVGPEFVRNRFVRLEAMFIDDWQREYDGLPFVHLINLSSNFDHLWDSSQRQSLLSQKKYDLCFMGYNSTGERARYLDHAVKRWSHRTNHVVLEKRPNMMDRFVRHDDYFSKMAQSRICINVPGASVGGRALRYYEIPYVGSFMLSRVFDALLLHPFKHLQHCAYFLDLNEMDELIALMLEDEGRRETIAAVGHQHAMTHHTIDARMDYVYRVIQDGLRVRGEHG